MSVEPKDKFFGTPMSEWIAKVPNELEIDAVGLWQIIPAGRVSFGLDGEALITFTRRCLLALLSRGAKPVVGAVGDEEHDWKIIEGYCGTNEEVADAIISEWLASGKDPDVGGIWFALPERL